MTISLYCSRAAAAAAAAAAAFFQHCWLLCAAAAAALFTSMVRQTYLFLTLNLPEHMLVQDLREVRKALKTELQLWFIRHNQHAFPLFSRLLFTKSSGAPLLHI